MLNIPSDSAKLKNRSLTDIARALPETANPFLEESWMGAVGIANADRVFEFYKQLAILEQEAIPITADQKLELWASVWGITLNPATKSTGTIVATGTAGSVIPQETELQSSGGESFTVANDVTITEKTVQLLSLTSVGTVASFTLLSDQSLFTDISVNFSGADQTEYNGTFPITVTGTATGTFEIPFAAVTPATGTITATFTSADMVVQSVGFGQSQNLAFNEKVTFSTPVVGVDAAAFVDFGEVGGGTDQETKDELRDRMLDRIQNPVAMFNVSAITAKAKEVPGVTDVFVFEITPNVGQVTIYFIRGNDENPIPSGSEVATVKNEILTIKPANTSDDDVIVSAPTPVNTIFVFSALSPNTATMQSAIEENLTAYFLDNAEVEIGLTQDAYRSVIINTVDATGAKVDSFTLSSPVGTIGGGAGEYPIYSGSVFP